MPNPYFKKIVVELFNLYLEGRKKGVNTFPKRYLSENEYNNAIGVRTHNNITYPVR